MDLPKLIDLARLAEGLDQPYRPSNLVASGSLEASLFVCDHHLSWQRDAAEGSMLFVLEGVLILQKGGERVLANEGEILVIPRMAGHSISAGMRSSVILLQSRDVDTAARNGHVPAHMLLDHDIQKVTAAADALRGEPFVWRRAGGHNGWEAHATRLWGQSQTYESSSEAPLLLIVYRGVLDYRVLAVPEDAATGSAVGSQMLIIPPGLALDLSSERGATVLALTRRGQALPQRTAVGTEPNDPDQP